MKQYYSKAEAPLLFHKFMHYFILPVGMLVTLAQLFYVIVDVSYFDLPYLIDIGYFVFYFVSVLVCFIGFFKWKPYAWYSLMVSLSLNLLYCLILIFMYAIYLPGNISTIANNLIYSLIYAGVVGTYYLKRKFLFVDIPRDVDGI